MILLLPFSYLDAKRYVFAFDYHDVLAQYDWKKAQALSFNLLKNPKTWLHLPLLPYIMYHAYKAHKKYNGGDSVIYTLVTQIPSLSFLKEPVFALANCWNPTRSMHILLKELKAQGHLLYLASNMEPDSLAYQQEQHKEFFALFDGICAAYALTKKPSQRYYAQLRTLVDSNQPNVPIIFVDDLEHNIKPLHNNTLNIHTLHYTVVEHLLMALEEVYNIKVQSLTLGTLGESHIQNDTILHPE